METDIKVWLSDMQQAINEIHQFLPEQKIFTEFQKDLKSKRAIERNIEIIGEALKNVRNINPDIEISHLNDIISTRNKLIHGYDSIDNAIIYTIVIKHIPILKEEITRLIEM